MAIQISGTTVVNDSRQLQNISSIDSATNTAISNAGFTKTTGDITGVTAGSGISGGGTSGTVTVSHADTSSQGSVNNSGSVFIQDISVDTYGHITSITSTTVPASTPTTAQVLSATAGATELSVGTYTLAGVDGSISPGDVFSGASLNISGIYKSQFSTDLRSTIGSSLSGTWKAFTQVGTNGKPSIALFLRIS